MEKVYGLIGLKLGHSFSKNYFDELFFREGLRDCRYELFPLETIQEISTLFKETKGLAGLNVTIPYKESVFEYLDEITPEAQEVGAVNVIEIDGDKKIGYNTDYIAFKETLERWLPNKKFKALVLGTGGSSKAVGVALQELGIPFTLVSRKKTDKILSYEDLKTDPTLIGKSKLIINTTPLGMHPKTEEMPDIPYDMITKEHFVYDLIYNPARTLFIQKAEMKGASFKNGLEMLHVQADKSWEIWNS